MNEISLLDALAKDSEKAMRIIYDEYYVLLCKIAHLRLNDQNLARDIVQELMMDLWNRRKTLDIKSHLKAYLIKSLIYKISRTNQYHRPTAELKISDQEVYNPVDELELNELRDRVNSIIDDMPDRVKECFLMSRAEGLKYKEIAQKLNISHKTVDHHIAKALKILKENLKLSLLIFFF